MIIGTAGHIDHGKTALVKALTGVDADRLKEEKARGITLDLGYAYWPLANGEVLGFVDVPGHEGLVRNMLAGATGIDFALLVVAADDGPMPQTQEHLTILQLLGIRRGAVALTKIDAVAAARVPEAREEIRALLANGPLAEVPTFPVSSVTGQGVADLRAHIEEAAKKGAQKPAEGYFRLAIDRVFTLNGVGLVVTGTAFSGRVRVGDRLVVSPAGLDARVRSLHVQDRKAESGRAGQRCALNLTGERLSKETLRRGDWLVEPAGYAPAQRLDVRLTLTPAAKTLTQWAAVHFHLGAGSQPARVVLLEGESLAPGGAMLAQIVLNRSEEARGLDCFVLRDPSARHTLGGGVVLDPYGPTRYRRSPARLAWLAALEHADHGEALGALLNHAGEADLPLFARARNLRPEEAPRPRPSLPHRSVSTRGADYLVSEARWRHWGDTILAALSRYHEGHPDLLGVDTERLQRLAAPAAPRAVIEAVLEELRRQGKLARSGPWWHLPEHGIRLGQSEMQLWNALSCLLATRPFEPPRVRDMARGLHEDEGRVRLTLKHLARLGEVYEVAHDHFFTRQAVAQLAEEIEALATEKGAVEAAAFRDRIATGRKLAIRILEFFDRIGYTRRVCDTHRLRRQGPALATMERQTFC